VGRHLSGYTVFHQSNVVTRITPSAHPFFDAHQAG
jgi:hypothetical protein